jgi:transcriptional regulator with XRE-family HTH domain
MPRKTDVANLDNPLRKLRQQFKLTQDKLGQLIGLNGDAVRNLENGRMKISGRIFRRIILALGAEYRPKRRAWFVPLSQTQCSPATLLGWRQAAKPDEALKREDQKCLCYRIGALLESVESRQYHMLFTKIYEFLDECLEEHPSPKAAQAFKQSKPEMTIVRKSGTPPLAQEEHLVTSMRITPEGVEEFTEIELSPLIISEITRSYQKFPAG